MLFGYPVEKSSEDLGALDVHSINDSGEQTMLPGRPLKRNIPFKISIEISNQTSHSNSLEIGGVMVEFARRIKKQLVLAK